MQIPLDLYHLTIRIISYTSHVCYVSSFRLRRYSSSDSMAGVTKKISHFPNLPFTSFIFASFLCS